MNKTALALGVVGVLTYSVPTMPVKAISNSNTQTVSDSNQIKTAGLISRSYITVSTSSNKLCLNGTTQSNVNMKSIGFKEISIQYSSDGKNWYEEKSIDDILESSSSECSFNNYSISVNGGYYYRVSLTHYAKESGLFGSSQSVDNTSNSVWID